MKTKLLTAIMLLFTLTLSYQFTQAKCDKNDWDALKALYDNTDGNNWAAVARISWETAFKDRMTPAPSCNLNNLYGIKLDGEGRVECIDLDTDPTDCKADENVVGGIGLNGSLPTELSKLTNLKYLNLLNLYNDTINVLTGSIPASLGSLKKLELINLAFHQLTGAIPIELTQLPNLETLALYGNQLTGSIPSQVANLTNLKELHLDGNKFTGEIPLQIANLPNLERLYIKNNQLSGEIPNEIICISSIDSISLSYNRLTGDVPVCQNSISNLSALWLSNNQLNGIIPAEIRNFKKLEKLDLSNNQLTGELPIQLQEMDNLWRLYISNNQLTGTIPPEIGNMPNLKQLFLNENKLRGSIPNEIGDLGSLEQLWLSNNALSGSIPASIGDLSMLTFLYLSNNLLTGPLPESIENLTKLEKLGLSYNYLSGNIPKGLGNINSLQELWLSSNNFEGIIPTKLIKANLRMSIANNYFNCNEVNNFTNGGALGDKPIYFTPQRYSMNDSGVISHVKDVNESITLEAAWNPGGSISYQWYRNEELIPNATNATYPIVNIQPENHAGIYHLHIKLSNCSSTSNTVEFISDPIILHVKDHDLFGQPIDGYTELVVQFDNEMVKEEFEKPLRQRGVIWKDKCDCNRELHLYDYAGDTMEDGFQQAYIALNQKIKSVKMPDVGIDGGFNYILNSSGFDEAPEQAFKVSYNYPPGNYSDVSISYILDSGLDLTNYNEARNFLLDAAPIESCFNFSAPGVNFSTEFDQINDQTITVDINYQDNVGHGTFGFDAISEGLVGANNAKIVPIKTTNVKKGGRVFDLICGLYHAIDNNADVINISAGYEGEPLGILEDAIYEAQQKGIFIVTSAGNKGLNLDFNGVAKQYPAYYVTKEREILNRNGNVDTVTYNNLITVAAVDHNGDLWEDSNYGKESVTLAAPGANIAGRGLADSVKVASGTSQAAFFVSQVLAREIARDNAKTLEQVRDDFEKNYLENTVTLGGFLITGKKIPFNWEPAEIVGCTDPNACNYNVYATENRNCKYCETDCPECPPDACPPCPGDLCINGILNDGEIEIDCGGSCPDCGLEGNNCNEIFEQYPWLTNVTECGNEDIIVYVSTSNYNFIEVVNGNSRILYYSDGAAYCFDSGVDGCIDHYQLNTIVNNCSCNQSSTPTCQDANACNFQGALPCFYGDINCTDPCDESTCNVGCPNPCEQYPFLQQFIDCNNISNLQIEIFDYDHYVFALVESNSNVLGYMDFHNLQYCSGSQCSTYIKASGPDITFSCGSTPTQPTSSCNDNTQNGNETGVDCGGSCTPCPSCFDGIQNGGEEGVDCGGSCTTACPASSDIPAIVSTYPFLEGLVDYNNCISVNIKVFDYGSFVFALIEDNNEVIGYYDAHQGEYCNNNVCFDDYAVYFDLRNLTDEWTCGQTANKTISNEHTSKSKVTQSFKMYPNPSSNLVHIELPNKINSNNTISIFDISGMLLHKNTFTGSCTTFNVNDLSKGMYLIELQNAQFNTTRKLLVE